jgi:hypothetical protein
MINGDIGSRIGQRIDSRNVFEWNNPKPEFDRTRAATLMENPWFSRPPGSLFETIISSYRQSLHLHLNLPLQSTLTGKPLKNSYRSSPQLRFLLLNLNSSRILVRLF